MLLKEAQYQHLVHCSRVERKEFGKRKDGAWDKGWQLVVAVVATAEAIDEYRQVGSPV